jgi:hypothetical protein
MSSLEYLNPMNAVKAVWRFLYVLVQYFVIAIFKPPPPKTSTQFVHPYGRVAVIGAGEFA